jgi:hypothetical protein
LTARISARRAATSSSVSFVTLIERYRRRC